jgi:hypothetical protein
MNIYDYINHWTGKGDRSKDVAEHCKSIGQTWTPFEMAVIIGQSDRSIAEKHAAWCELIFDYPDMPTIPNYKTPVYHSLHEALNELIAFEECIELFLKKQEKEVYYEYIVDMGWDSESDKVNQIYSQNNISMFEEAWNDAKMIWETSDSKSDTDRIKIKKFYEGDETYAISAEFDTLGVLYDYNLLRGEYIKNFSSINKRILQIFHWNPFYVYMPLPWVPEYKMLDKYERMLFYKIQAIIDKWDPLGLTGITPADEYCYLARDVFNILQKGGGEKTLNTYWEKFRRGNHILQDFMDDAKVASEKLVKLV